MTACSDARVPVDLENVFLLSIKVRVRSKRRDAVRWLTMARPTLDATSSIDVDLPTLLYIHQDFASA